jgi:hypothetical protein
MPKRTAKSCGPDASVVGVKSCGGAESPTGPTCRFPQGDGGKKARYSGVSAYKPSSHCAGNVGSPPLPCMLVCALFAQFCARDRGCSAHPAFPAPSFLSRDNDMQTSGTCRRENADVYLLFEPIGRLRLNQNSNNVIARSSLRRSNPSYNQYRCEMDCFASLAMTVRDSGQQRRFIRILRTTIILRSRYPLSPREFLIG